MITRSRSPDDPAVRIRDKDFKRTITNMLKNFKGVVHKMRGNFHYKMKSLKKETDRNPITKNIISKMKNSLGRLNNKLDTAKERINVLEQVNGNYLI